MAYTENFSLNKQMNSNNYSDGMKTIPMLPNGRFIALPFLIFLLWIFLSVLTQFTFINGANNNAATSGIAGIKKSPASATLVFNGSSKGYNLDLIQKGVFILRNSK